MIQAKDVKMRYNHFQLVILLVIVNIFKNTVLAKRRGNGKKKVVIIGEMSDMYELLANASLNDDDVDYDDLNRNKYSKRKGNLPTKNVFVPVAAYSVTHNQPPGHRVSAMPSVNRFRFRDKYSVYQTESSSPVRTTESAVYGYLNRPDIVEFKGQYFYGPNPLGQASMQSSASIDALSQPTSATPLSTSKRGLGPGGLLLATLPLVLAPMLSYLFTPMIIPVTATIAAGKRRKRREINTGSEWRNENYTRIEKNLNIPINFTNDKDIYYLKRIFNGKDKSAGWNSGHQMDPRLKEVQIVANYLRKIHFDENDCDRAIANYLECNGLLSNDDQCLERMACEFGDKKTNTSSLDRSVTSILLAHILKNNFISQLLKQRVKSALLFGRKNSEKCDRYKCSRPVNL